MRWFIKNISAQAHRRTGVPFVAKHGRLIFEKFTNFSKTGRCRYIKAFSLVELSLILVVMSFVSVAMMANNKQEKSLDRKYETAQELKDLNSALATYKNAFGHYPCPANPTIALSSIYFGVGTGSGTGICSATNMADDGTVVMGMIPTKTLAISSDNAFDKWGRRIAYAVTEAATDDPGSAAEIKVVYNWDEEGSDPNDLGAVKLKAVPYVIVSYGEDGIGAYTKDGSAQIQAVSTGGSDVRDSDLQNENHSLYGSGFNSVFINPEGRFTQEKIDGQTPAATQVALTFDDVVTHAAGVSGLTCGECIVDNEGVCEAGANTIPCLSCSAGGGTWNSGTSSCVCVAPATWNGSTCVAPIHMSDPSTFTWSSPDHFSISNDNINLTAYNPPAYTDLSGVATTTMTVGSAGNYRFTGAFRGRSGGYGLARIYVNGSLYASTTSASYIAYDFTVPLNAGGNTIQLNLEPANGLNCCGNTMEVRAAYIAQVP